MDSRSTLLGRPLDWVFSAPSHVAVLRALRDSKEGMSGRAVARAAGINHQACALAIRRLEALGVLRRHGSGKTQLISLNPEHVLISEILLPALRKERELVARLRDEIAAGLERRVLSAALFGSAARGEESPGSDVDVLLVVPGPAKESASERAREFGLSFSRRYGLRFSPIVMTVRQAKERRAKADPLLENIMRDAIDIGPKPLREVIG